MKLTIIHPEQSSLATIDQAIQENTTLYRSPHVGNVNAAELGLLFGVAERGGTLQLEMVDTIRGDDKYSNPRVAYIGESVITLASRNYAKSRIVGACEVTDEAKPEDLANLLGGTTLKEVHINSLIKAVPESATVTSSTEYFSSIGKLAYGLVLQKSAEVLGRPIRMVTTEGKYDEAPMYDDSTTIYGFEQSKIGLIPPLEAMMAIEIIKKTMDSDGSDASIVHVGGPDMINYTKLEQVMQPTSIIAGKVLAELGIGNTTNIDYVVPCLKTIVSSPDFNTVISDTVRSQYDILIQMQEERQI